MIASGKFRILPTILLLCTLAQPIFAEESFSVMTYNILAQRLELSSGIDHTNIGWDNPTQPRKERVRAILEQEDADIIGFQEVTDNQLSDLIDFLPEFDYLGGAPVGFDVHFYDVIFFRRDRFLLTDTGGFRLPPVDIDNVRHLWWGNFFDRETSRSLVLANSHLRPLLAPNDGQAVFIQEEMPAVVNGSPYVHLGDMNYSPNAEGYRILIGESGPQNLLLNDACAPFCGDSPTYPSGSRIDHIFHSDEFDVSTAEIVEQRINGLLPSDHFPVTAILTNHSAPIPTPASLRRSVLLENVAAQIVWERSLGDLNGLGDGRGGAIIREIGSSPRESPNGLVKVAARQVLKFQLPVVTQVPTEVESAVLRIAIEEVLGTLPEGLDVTHGLSDNNPIVEVSDYEAPYVDTGLNLLVPPNGAGDFYEIDVTRFVKADYQADGSDPWSAFRLELTNIDPFLEQTAAYIIEASELEVVFKIVPEPTTSILVTILLLFTASTCHRELETLKLNV